MFLGGYLGKALRVDLSQNRITEETIRPDLVRKYLGGRGLGATYYYREIGPGVHPLSPQNKLFFFTGPLTGVKLPATTKFQVTTKSPETGHYLCSNSSGHVGPHLKFCGYDGLIIEGRAEHPVYLWISEAGVEIRDASDIWDLNVGEAARRLREKVGNSRAAVMTIGLAAVNRVAMACIMVDGRSFGRGGAGTVMASKNLKAVVVFGTGTIPLADAAGLDAVFKEAVTSARTGKAAHSKYGTAQYTEPMNQLGCYPTRNFQTSYFESAETISHEYITEHYKVRNQACYRCPVGCAQVGKVREGPFEGFQSDPEYETIGSFGGQCGVGDYAAVIAANALCDEYGLDTMSTGTIIAYAMECFERGYFTLEDTQGIELRFGNCMAMVEMIKQIAERRGLGDALAEGFMGLAKRYPETIPSMMHVKWMPFAAYEPRGFHGIGLSFGTSSRGACHNVGGWTIRDELMSGQYDRYAVRGKGLLVKRIQDTRAYIDSLGICTVVRSSMGFSDKPSGRILEYVTGVDFTPELMTIGARIYSLERLILVREGVARKDDMLPERMEEPLPTGPAAGHALTREMYEIMLDEYYEARGWDSQGVPTEEGLASLGIDLTEIGPAAP